MSETTVGPCEEVIKGLLNVLMRARAEGPLMYVEVKTEKLTQAVQCKRNEQRQGYRTYTFLCKSSTLPDANVQHAVNGWIIRRRFEGI